MTKIPLLTGLIFFQFVAMAQNYNAELISQVTNIAINNNKLRKEVAYEIQINNRAGEKYGHITIPYSKLEKVSNINAYIKDSKGRTVKKLKKSEMVERSSISDFSFYEDDFVKEFTLKHNTYPYSVVYAYQIQESEFLYLDYWAPVLDEEIPTRSAQLNISVPVGYPIAYKNQLVEAPAIDTLEDAITYRWHTHYTNFVTPEVLSPPISGFLPSVAVIPGHFQYDEAGSFENWFSYGDWQNKLLQGISELPEQEKKAILGLTKDMKEDKEKIRALYHYLQDNTRYINISIETGGLKPHPAMYVSQNKYGDCKALTNYCKALLAYVGIPSYYTKVYAGSPIQEVDTAFPSQQFNHVILYIPQKDGAIWLDCTSGAAFDYLGTFTQNRAAFVIDNHNSHFVRTPPLAPSDVLETRHIEIGYHHKEATVKFRNRYKGNMYENLLYLDKNYNASEKARIARNYFTDDGFQLMDYEIVKSDRDTAKIELHYEATAPNIYKHYGNDVLLSNIAFAMPQFEKPGSRNLPVQIDYPIYKIDTLAFEIPDGYTYRLDSTPHTLTGKFGKYTYQRLENEGKIIVIKSLLINTGQYPLSEYKDFYKFYSQVMDIENKTILSLKKSD